MKEQLYKLAKSIKERRSSMGLKLKDLAERAQISKSLLSKIENNRTIPSLPVIMRIAQGLQTNLGDLASGIEIDDVHDYIIVRKTEREIKIKEEAVGFRYESLVTQFIDNLLFEVSILTLKKGAKRKPVSSDGNEFVFILQGSIDFHLGHDKFHLTEGDAIFFDGRIPHVPRNTSKEDTVFLVVYLIEQSNEEK